MASSPPQDSAASRAQRAARVLVDGLATAALLALCAYLLLATQRTLWSGDVRAYVAAVREVLTSPFAPGHECLGLPATTSLVMSPYVWWVAALGFVFDLGAYDALQVAAALNVVLVISGALHLASRSLWGGRRDVVVVAALWFTLALFGRDLNFGWSGELSGQTLPRIIGYPSVWAWGLTMHTLALAERALNGARVLVWASIVVGVWLTVTCHGLTGSWLVGILGLRGLFEIARRPRAGGLRAGGTLIVVVLAGSAASALWPYLPFLNTSVVTQPENAPLGEHPFETFKVLYTLAAVAWVRLVLARDLRALWFAIVWLASTAMFFLLTDKGIDFGTRYIFFMAIPAQWAVAVQAASDIGHLITGRALQRVVATVGLTVVVAGVCEVAHVNLDRMRPPSALWADGDAAPRYVADVAPFARHLDRRHLVFVGDDTVGMRLTAATGARIVNVRYQHHIKDTVNRRRDEKNFYRASALPQNRQALARRWGVTHALLLPGHRAQRAAFEQAFGPPIAEHGPIALFRTGVKPKPRPRAR